MPPLRLSTFDPFGSQLSVSTPTTPVPDAKQGHSPRLEARGTEPVPPPPPPRWCKPQLVPAPVQESDDQSAARPASHPPPTPTRPDGKKPAVLRRRKPRRSDRTSVPSSPHCHHSTLADKASDYEDIWAASPTASHSEDDGDGRPPGRRSGSPPDDDSAPLIDLSGPDVAGRRRDSVSSRSSSSSRSTVENETSESSLDGRRDSRSLTSSPETALGEDPDRIEPPEAFQQPKEEPVRTEAASVTLIEIRSSPTSSPTPEKAPEKKEDDKENQPEIAMRRRTSNSSNESKEETTSRRTSPLYSEPADALPPEVIAQIARAKAGRPLPVPPFGQPVADVSTFTKDGYVRCTLPALTQPSPIATSSLPPVASKPSNGGLVGHPRSKHVALPKPPLPLPNQPAASPVPAEHRRAFPSLIYLPPEDSVTIQARPYFNELFTSLYLSI